jgi:hypothetical protein
MLWCKKKLHVFTLYRTLFGRSSRCDRCDRIYTFSSQIISQKILEKPCKIKFHRSFEPYHDNILSMEFNLRDF